MMRWLQRFGVLALGASLLLVSVSAAQRDQQDQRKPRDQKDQREGPMLTDDQFARMASMGNLAEINLGMMAEKKGSTREVRDFAQRLVRDHQKANQKLNRILDRMRIPAAPSMGPRHEQLATRLGAMQGRDFDHAFAEHMVRDHERTIRMFEQEAKHGQNRELRDFAKDTLPDLQEHLKMAERLTGGRRGGGHDERTPATTDHDRTHQEKGTTEKGTTEKSTTEKSTTEKSRRDQDKDK